MVILGWYLLGLWVCSVPGTKFSLHWVCFFCSGAGTKNEDDDETESVPLMTDGYVLGFYPFFFIYGSPALISILTFRNNTVHCGFSTFAHFLLKISWPMVCVLAVFQRGNLWKQTSDQKTINCNFKERLWKLTSDQKSKCNILGDRKRGDIWRDTIKNARF